VGKNRFMGVEVTGKTLGLIGAGNIGSIVASRALGLRMKVVAYDPFLTPERAIEIGVEKADLDTLLAKADFITLHTPLTSETRNILSRENLAKTKKGVRIVNCARGGLIDEAALKDLLDSGHIAGAALDVFETEPAKESPLFGTPNVICTPHLGASTTEAQVNVALQVAEQMAEFLTTGGVTNALNMPSLSAEEAPKLKPYMALAEKLGALVGQLVGDSVKKIAIEVEGAAAQLNQKPITAAVLAGLMKQYSQTVNMVNAPFLAKERGLDVREVRHEREGEYRTLVRVTVGTDEGERRLPGRCSAMASRAWSKSSTSRSKPTSTATCSTSSTPTRRASSVRSGLCWASPTSTSAPSTSVVVRRVVKPCCCFRWTARSATKCWQRPRPSMGCGWSRRSSSPDPNGEKRGGCKAPFLSAIPAKGGLHEHQRSRSPARRS
jgi:D-3-phosphoglycerate dehydrogenase